ncbi:MAG: PQQ-binding-like beta-propeller repeat protein [Saprospiraceae bacterium]
MKSITKQVKNSFHFYLLFVLTLSSCSSSWTTFQANNQRTGLVDRKEIQEPEVLWKTEIGIQGYLNNSLVAGDFVYVGSSGTRHNDMDEKDGVYCLNKKTGAIKWHFPMFDDACGIAYAFDKIYATGDGPLFSCIDAFSGEKVWELELGGSFSQPLIVDTLVIFGNELEGVSAIHAMTGEYLWELPSFNSPIRGGLSADDEFIYATFLDGTIACIDFYGEVIWTQKCEYMGSGGICYEVYPAPTVTDSLVIVGFARYSYYKEPAVNAYDKKTGKLVWAGKANAKVKSSFGNMRSSVALWENQILFGSAYSNDLVAMDAIDGSPIWTLSMGDSMFPHWPSPIIAGNTLYLGRHDGGFNAIDLVNRKVLWQLYLGDHKNIVLRDLDYGMKDNSSDWDPASGSSIYSTPSLDEKGNIYVGTGEGWFYSIGNR